MAEEKANNVLIKTKQGYLVVDPASAWIAAVTIKPMATKFRMEQNMISVAEGKYKNYHIKTNESGCVYVAKPDEDKGYYIIDQSVRGLKSTRNDQGFSHVHNKYLTYYPSNGYFYFHDVGDSYLLCDVQMVNA
eukprot:486946_1